MFGQKDIDKLNELVSTGAITQREIAALRKEFDKFSSGVETPIGTVKAGEFTFEHIISKHPEMREVSSIQSIKTVLENPSEIYRTKDLRGNEANMYLSKESDKIVLVRKNIVTAYRPKLSYLESRKKRGEKIW